MGDLPPGNYPDCFSASTTLAGLLWGYHDALASLGLTTSNNDTLGDRVSLFYRGSCKLMLRSSFVVPRQMKIYYSDPERVAVRGIASGAGDPCALAGGVTLLAV